MSRFKKAFNDFFDKLEFEKIDSNSLDEKKIVFNKNGKEISIDDLSTGEKQIVFRGAQLLRNANNLTDGIILIDEPELSMHPRWQAKILKFYRDLFKKNGKQSSQIIIATHSEYVLRSALEDRDNALVIVLTEEGGAITAKSITAPTVLPTITAAETNYLAFNIASIDYHIQLYGHLQLISGKSSIKDCDTYISNNSLYDAAKYGRPSSYKSTTYQTLPTYIRNAIDHPDSGNTFTDEELRISIEFLIELLK